MSARITKQLLKAAMPDDVPAKKTPKGTAKAKASVKVVKPASKKKQLRQFLEEAKVERTKNDNTEKNLSVLKRMTEPKVQSVMERILQEGLK
ncbi:hypothetical protein AC1031_008194 [Aphanomyces cochlioides]|nr:hypothetical protein AC1031_008194 [Aphanomyces cochlioides]